ncbi:hypothetical protein [Microcoleus sp. D2_18a_D3]|uniref:hypothetical protein n=1 Tax=Microcoleus sp. D2_18a_D3 TaxID=3055330 RepID=UPI002FD36241
MNQSIVKRSLFFLAVFTCIQVPIAAMGQPTARSNYEAINAKHRIELRLRQNKWEIVWIGRQSKCQPNRGHQNWASGLCK